MSLTELATVSPCGDARQVDRAWQAIAEFEESRVGGVWTALDKQQVIAEMRSRLSNPCNINQGGQPFCGPASVLFELVRTQPVRYVEICRNLFQIGGFHGITKWIPASERLRQCQGDLQMPQVDWMVLSTLRETENLFFPVEPDAPEIVRNLGGMTKSWELKGWLREIHGFRDIQYHHAYLRGDRRALRQATGAIAAGGGAFALVTSEGLLTPNPPRIPYPSHWITLLGNITINGGCVSFDAYTWGRIMQVEIEERQFQKYFWGVVTGCP